MTPALFYDLPKTFNVRRSQKERKALLFIDNCGAHCRSETLPDLDGVEVFFLPPNITSKMQPCDAGIIANVKVRYRRSQMKRAFDLREEEVSEIYKLDVLTAKLACQKIWEKLPASTIKNCWEHTGFCSGVSSNTEAPTVSDEQQGALQSFIDRAVPAYACIIDILQLLNPEEENECVEEINNVNMAERVLSQTAVENEIDINDEIILLPSFHKQLAALGMV